MDGNNIQNLLRTNFNDLTRFAQGRQFLQSSNANAEWSLTILEKLQTFVQSNVMNLETLCLGLDLCAGCNKSALILAVNLIVDEYLLYTKRDQFDRSVLLKRAFSTIGGLLTQLVNDNDLSDMETFDDTIPVDMVDRLTKLKMRYASSEL